MISKSWTIDEARDDYRKYLDNLNERYSRRRTCENCKFNGASHRLDEFTIGYYCDVKEEYEEHPMVAAHFCKYFGRA